MSRGGSRTAATSTMKRFVTIVSDWKPDNYYHKELHLGYFASDNTLIVYPS